MQIIEWRMSYDIKSENRTLVIKRKGGKEGKEGKEDVELRRGAVCTYTWEQVQSSYTVYITSYVSCPTGSKLYLSVH